MENRIVNTSLILIAVSFMTIAGIFAYKTFFYDPKNERLCLDDKQSGETSLLLPQSFKEHRIRWWCRDHNRTHKSRARLLFNMVKSRLDQFSRV